MCTLGLNDRGYITFQGSTMHGNEATSHFKLVRCTGMRLHHISS